MKKGLVLLVTLGLLFIPLVAYGLPSSIGIVADGIRWTNGVLTPYEVNTNGIAASVQIHSISTNPPYPGASLQLNAILHVTTTNGTADYFIQNILQIDNTRDKTAYFENNVWSLSEPTDRSGICAVGNQPCYPYYDNQQYYATSTEPFTYQLPFSTSLVMTEDVVPNHFVEISFMHIEHGNTQLYDHYYLPIQNVVSASFLIKEQPSNHVFYVAGLVWGGSGNGSSAYFDSMDSSLNLQYDDTNSNAWKPFPDYSSNGYVSTAETAQNIYSIIEPNFPGQALVKWGNIANQNSMQTSMNEPQTNQPISNTPTNQQSYSSVSISTNMNAYLPGDSIVITGRVPVSGIPLSIQVLDPSNHLVKLDQVNVNSDGRYGTIISAGGPAWSTSGIYTIQAKGSPNISAQTTFQFGGSTDAQLKNTIPEFGTFVSIVFLIGIITTMVISARVRRFSKINRFLSLDKCR
ncbi:MAG: thermopsin family protease [Thaumarchaeota archaeon]|nr:thermopsin family protease [Nitrososphaerota archaeon]